MTNKSAFYTALHSAPWMVQVFLLLCQVLGIISWPGWLLWSPVLAWLGILAFLFVLMILLAIMDGGGRRRA